MAVVGAMAIAGTHARTRHTVQQCNNATIQHHMHIVVDAMHLWSDSLSEYSQVYNLLSTN